MAHRLSPEAVLDLDDMVRDLAERGATLAIAERLVSAITERLHLLARYPYIGRSRDHDFGPGRRSYVVADHVVIYRVEGADVLVLRIVHGRRDIESLFN